VEEKVSVAVFAAPGVSLTITLVPVKVEFVNSTEGALPGDGDTDAVSVTAPVKPILFNVMVALAEDPTTMTPGLAELVAISKSELIVITTFAVWGGTPLPDAVRATV
jgi:hypothetical protein